MADTYDLVVIGAGPGGYVAAIRAAQLGMKVAVVEKRDRLGGTCLNVGCIPSKALLDSSEHFHVASEKLARHGVKVSGVSLDLPTMLARKDKVVKDLTDGLRFLFKKNQITAVPGTGSVEATGKVRVKSADGADSILEAKNILLATGSEPIQLPFMPFDGKSIVSSTEALCFDKVPEHLVVVGGGVIGLELGSVWRRLGSKVTVIEFLPRIVPFADVEIGNALYKSLMKQGLEFYLETKVTGAKAEGGKLKVSATDKAGKALEFPCDKVLVSVGRRGYLDGLGLDKVGVTHDPKSGKVQIDDHFRTNVPGIWAIGDIVAGPMLAHKAEDEGVACAEIMAGKHGHVNYDAIPNVTYTHPELASVGRTEEQLKDAGVAYKVGKYPFLPNGRAKAMDETEGLIKILADAKSDRVLGVHIVGARASDLIAEAVTIIEFHGSSEDIARTSHAHPTLSEVMREAAMAVDKRAIHG